MTRPFNGSCHCGAIGFTYRTILSPSEWPIRACQCSFCRCHDALSTSDPQGDLSFHAERPDCLQRYQFGLRTADFLLCRNCGVYLGAVMFSGQSMYGIINTHALKPQPEHLAETQPIDYEGEKTDGRVSRRIDRWTPVSSCPDI